MQNALTLKTLWLNRKKHSITFSSKPLSERTHVPRLPSEFKYLPSSGRNRNSLYWCEQALATWESSSPALTDTAHEPSLPEGSHRDSYKPFVKIPPPNWRQDWFPSLWWSAPLSGYCLIIPARDNFSLRLVERLLKRKSFAFRMYQAAPKWQVFSKEDNLPTRGLLLRFTQLHQLNTARRINMHSIPVQKSINISSKGTLCKFLCKVALPSP